jgi:ABC-type uncharacterized transport system auxiliary subunit
MKRTLTRLSLGASLLLAACAQPELPQDHYYRLEVPTPQQGLQTLDGVLEVERFRADGLLSGRPIAYSEGKGHLSEYHYHFWVEPPVDLLQEIMVDFLRASNIARHVVTPELRMEEDYLLTGKIKRLERILSNGNKIAVELELGLKRTSDDHLLVLKTYYRELEQDTQGVGGAVRAMNAALNEIYQTFLNDVKAGVQS